MQIVAGKESRHYPLLHPVAATTSVNRRSSVSRASWMRGLIALQIDSTTRNSDSRTQIVTMTGQWWQGQWLGHRMARDASDVQQSILQALVSASCRRHSMDGRMDGGSMDGSTDGRMDGHYLGKF